MSVEDLSPYFNDGRVPFSANPKRFKAFLSWECITPLKPFSAPNMYLEMSSRLIKDLKSGVLRDPTLQKWLFLFDVKLVFGVFGLYLII